MRVIHFRVFNELNSLEVSEEHLVNQDSEPVPVYATGITQTFIIVGINATVIW